MRVYIVIVIACLPVLPARAKYAGGSGTPDDPYRIATAGNLIALGKTPDDYDKHFVLTASIDLNPSLPGRKVFDAAIIAPDTYQWVDSYGGTHFSGVFDGNGHTISHLTVGSGRFLGLFGALSENGSVSNLCLEAVEITGTGVYLRNLKISDGNFVGSLAGFSRGRITNCCSTGSVSGTGDYVGGLVGQNYYEGSITYSYNNGMVSGTGDHTGGLVGLNAGRITNCHSSGSVTGIEDVGGLVGDDRGSITTSYSTSSVSGDSRVGGLVGIYGDVTNCYSTGLVSGIEDVGGLVGASYNGSITNCYSAGPVSGEWSVGGLVGDSSGMITASFWDKQTSGQSESAGGTGNTTAGMRTEGTFLEAGWDFINETENGTEDIWWVIEGKDYPSLWWERLDDKETDPRKTGYSGGSGTADDPYQIATATDLIALGETFGDYDKHFIMTSNIDLHPYLPGRKVFVRAVIAPHGGTMADPFRGTRFTGVFDGSRYTVSNLTITGKDYLGLFGRLGPTGSVSTVVLEAVQVDGTGEYVSGLVGFNEGSITASYSTGTVRGDDCVGGLVGGAWKGGITNSYSTCSVSGNRQVGGLVGFNSSGSITNCRGTNSSSGNSLVGGLVGQNYNGSITDCHSTGSVTAISSRNTEGYSVGGLVGSNSGNGSLITYCCSTCSVSGTGWSIGGFVGFNDSGITASYSTGSVNGERSVGGLVGSNSNDGSITDCYSAGAVSGTGWALGGLIGSNSGISASSFWDIVTSGQITSAGGTGKTTAEMQTADTFLEAGWDFVDDVENGIEDIWWILEGQDYPRLWWELTEEVVD